MATHALRNSSGDFIPQNAARFREWAMNISEYITASKATMWGIPTNVITDLKTKAEDFAETQDSLPNDPNRAQLARRNQQQRELTELIRFIVRFYLRRPVVTDPELIAMGIPPIDRRRTARKTVAEKVEFTIHISGIRRIVVDFWQQGVEHSKAKPRAYDGAVLIWNFGKERPAEAGGFQHHTMASRRPFAIEFDEDDRGKTVWIALAWQNKRGIRGEWSEFKSAVIP